MKQRSAEILCIGTEILMGDIINTNAAYIAKELAGLGINVYHQSVVGEYIRHPGAVAIVPVLADGSVVLVKQCRYPLATLLWEIPAGKLDHGVR